VKSLLHITSASETANSVDNRMHIYPDENQP